MTNEKFLPLIHAVPQLSLKKFSQFNTCIGYIHLDPDSIT